MNKKAYINPELEVIKIATVQMLADSVISNGAPGSADDAEAPGLDFDTNMFGF